VGGELVVLFASQAAATAKRSNSELIFDLIGHDIEPGLLLSLRPVRLTARPIGSGLRTFELSGSKSVAGLWWMTITPERKGDGPRQFCLSHFGASDRRAQALDLQRTHPAFHLAGSACRYECPICVPFL
jgi:hypothetical protein